MDLSVRLKAIDEEQAAKVSRRKELDQRRMQRIENGQRCLRDVIDPKMLSMCDQIRNQLDTLHARYHESKGENVSLLRISSPEKEIKILIYLSTAQMGDGYIVGAIEVGPDCDSRRIEDNEIPVQSANESWIEEIVERALGLV